MNTQRQLPSDHQSDASETEAVVVPKFFHPLSFDEQRNLTKEEALAYCDFILSRPLKTKVRRTDEEALDSDYDRVESGMIRAEIGD